MNRIKQWWRCVVRHECGPVFNNQGCPVAIYTCERAACPGRAWWTANVEAAS